MNQSRTNWLHITPIVFAHSNLKVAKNGAIIWLVVCRNQQMSIQGPKLSSEGCPRFPWMKLLVHLRNLRMYAELFTKNLQILIRSPPVCSEATLQMEALFKRSVSYPVWGFHTAHGQTRCGKTSAWFTLDWLEKVYVPVCLLVLWDAFSKCKHFGRVWVDRLFHKIELYQVQSYR